MDAAEQNSNGSRRTSNISCEADLLSVNLFLVDIVRVVEVDVVVDVHTTSTLTNLATHAREKRIQVSIIV